MSAAAISAGSLDSEDWKACALPWKVPITDGGIPISRAAWFTASTASPSATPGCRLKLSVTAGNCPWWAIDSGPIWLESTCTSVESGTAAPVSGDFTYRRSSEVSSRCWSGGISRMIQ